MDEEVRFHGHLIVALVRDSVAVVAQGEDEPGRDLASLARHEPALRRWWVADDIVVLRNGERHDRHVAGRAGAGRLLTLEVAALRPAHRRRSRSGAAAATTVHSCKMSCNARGIPGWYVARGPSTRWPAAAVVESGQRTDQRASERVSDTESLPEGPSRDSESLRTPEKGGADPATAALGPGDAVGRYQIRALLGAGGMGQVFTAFDTELGRAIALKVIRYKARSSSSRARAWLLREAQALAKVQHPNVVAIYDVGTKGDQVFIAMELIAGQTLTDWLAASARPWRAIRDVFIAAGRGLAAVHEVGIVHRDFKPANVIVSENRVVVVDFGLARAHAGEPDGDGDAEPDSDGEDLEPGQSSALDLNLTLTGEAVGTPRYMAPEQYTEGPLTALSDQFSFAVSLWEALFGAPPFAGTAAAERRDEMARGLAPPPAERKVPEHVRAALARALAVRPGDRWPSLADLLVELSRDPAATRRRALAIAGLAVAVVAAPLAFIVGQKTPVQRCAMPDPGLWDDATRTAVRSAFLATQKPFAQDSFERVDAALGTRVVAWSAARREACAATEIRHEQSASLMDARMACLSRARDQIAAFVGVLRAADARGVESATSAAPAIGDLDACENALALTSVMPPPLDPQVAAAVDELDRETARVAALRLGGKKNEAKAAGPALVERALALGHPPLLARALYAVGDVGCEIGDPREGIATLYQAARAAGAARDDVLAARIYTKLVFCVGVKDSNVQAGLALAESAEAALARAGTPLELRARLYRQESRLRNQASDLVNAFGFAELSLMSYQRLYDEGNFEVGVGLASLGQALTELGAYRAALPMFARALPIFERSRGPTHPAVATHLLGMADALAEAGDLDASAAAFERALAIQEQNDGPESTGIFVGDLANLRFRQGQLTAARDLALRARAIDEEIRRPDHPDLGLDMYLLSGIAVDRGELDDAQKLSDQALPILIAAFGPDHPLVAGVLGTQAQIARKRHEPARARQLIEKALAMHRKALGPRHPYVANDDGDLAAILLEAGEARAALPLLEEALAIQVNARNDDADEVVNARTLLAETLLATGDPARALALAERAVAATSTRGLRAELEGRARFALAQALGASDRPRAVELARQARALLAAWPSPDDVERIDRWLGRDLR